MATQEKNKGLSDKRLNSLIRSFDYNMRCWHRGLAEGRPPKPCDMNRVAAKMKADAVALKITAEVSRRRKLAIDQIKATPQAKAQFAKHLTLVMF